MANNKNSMESLDGEKEFNKEDFTDEELLDAHTHVWSHMFQFVNSMSLKCAVQLGIADIIKNHGSPIPLSKLIDALPVAGDKSNCVHRLMRLLVHSKFFIQVNLPDGDAGYWLTPSSRLLLKDSPFSMNPYLLLVLDPFFTKPYEFLSQWLADDRPTAFETAHGMSFWEGVGSPSFNQFFNEAMAADSRVMSHVVMGKECKKYGLFDGLESMVDVGGGTGTMAKAVAEAYPGMKCMVLDLPHVVAGLEDVGNLTFVKGNMFENIPASQAVLLKWILHDWSDEECVKILKNCRNAISEARGKVIVIDVVVNETEGEDGSKVKEHKLNFDVAMMVYLNGKERTEKEWEKLFLEAGFAGYKIFPALGIRSIIEVYP